MPPRRSSGRLSRGRLSADNNNNNNNNSSSNNHNHKTNSSTSPLTESPTTNGRVTRSRRSMENNVSSHKVAAAAASVGIGTGPVSTIPEEPTKTTTRRTSARGRRSKDATVQQDATAMPPPPIPSPTDVAAAIAPTPTQTSTSTSTSSQPLASTAAATAQEQSQSQLQQQQHPPATAITQDSRIKYIRSKGLRKAFARAIEKSTSNLTYENFAKCFPTISRYRPEVLQHVYNQVIPTWTERVNEELEHLCNEREVYTRLDELDRLIFEAKERKTTLPTHSTTTVPQTPIGLSPIDLVTAHLIPLLTETELSMMAELERVQRNVERLRKEKEETEREMVRLGKTVEGGLAVVQQTADAMRELGDLEEIEREVDAMDEGAT